MGRYRQQVPDELIGTILGSVFDSQRYTEEIGMQVQRERERERERGSNIRKRNRKRMLHICVQCLAIFQADTDCRNLDFL